MLCWISLKALKVCGPTHKTVYYVSCFVQMLQIKIRIYISTMSNKTTGSRPVTQCSFLKSKITSVNQIKFLSVGHIAVKAPSNVMGSVSSKPTVRSVKSSHGSPGKTLVSRVYKSASVMVFRSHVYERPAKLENRRPADAKQSLRAWRSSNVFKTGE